MKILKTDSFISERVKVKPVTNAEWDKVKKDIETRNNPFGITEKDPMEIYVDGSSIVLKKFEPNCIFCGNTKNLLEYHDKLICTKCSEKISNLKNEE